MSFFRKARLHVRLGKTILIHYNPDGTVDFAPEIAIANGGATIAMVYDISARFDRVADDSKEQLSWVGNQVAIFDEKTGRTNTRFHGFPDIKPAPGTNEHENLRLDSSMDQIRTAMYTRRKLVRNRVAVYAHTGQD